MFLTKSASNRNILQEDDKKKLLAGVLVGFLQRMVLITGSVIALVLFLKIKIATLATSFMIAFWTYVLVVMRRNT